MQAEQECKKRKQSGKRGRGSGKLEQTEDMEESERSDSSVSDGQSEENIFDDPRYNLV
jgi:hypothetical protein